MNENSDAGIALKKARQTGTLLVSAQTAYEYFEVFSRPKFEKYVSLETRLAFIENIISNALAIEPKERIDACRDPKDNMFLELAITANATCIISGDQDLLVLNPFRNIPIILPPNFYSFQFRLCPSFFAAITPAKPLPIAPTRYNNVSCRF